MDSADGNYLKQWWIIQLLKPVAHRANKIWKLVARNPQSMRRANVFVNCRSEGFEGDRFRDTKKNKTIQTYLNIPEYVQKWLCTES